MFQDADGTREVGRATGPTATIQVPTPHKWSPGDPFLYDVRVTLKSGDTVESYFGMRKIALGKDAAGVNRLIAQRQAALPARPARPGLLARRPLHRADRRGARYDIEMTKKLGFNMIRKHVKVEPERWYYWCDKLGCWSGRTCPAATTGTCTGMANRTRPPAARSRISSAS